LHGVPHRPVLGARQPREPIAAGRRPAHISGLRRVSGDPRSNGHSPAGSARGRPRGHSVRQPDDDRGRALPLWLIVVLGLAGATIAVWGMHALSGLLAPILLAFVLTVVAQPLVPFL